MELEKSDGSADELNKDNRFHWKREREKRGWQNTVEGNKIRKLNLLEQK